VHKCARWTPWARIRGTSPDPIPCSPQCASRRLPHRQTGVEQQRPEASHGVPASQARQRRPLLHQPGQPRAGALADLGARVLELRERTSVKERAERTRGGAAAGARGVAGGLRARPSPRPSPRGPASPRLTFSSSSAAGPSSSSGSVPFAAAASA
uniref:Uncharacterized protein n=1 Tax=Balaenoptera musculus TaxID=9771 RepID=A0A8C0I272_BALMU